jgi:hypothetical protein
VTSLNWNDYYGMIEADTDLRRDRWPNRCLLLRPRLAVLQAVRGLFARHQHFLSINAPNRQRIAGVVRTLQNGIDFGWFGNMGSAGRFKGAISKNDSNLSQALDFIPRTGAVSLNSYLDYITHFRKALPKGGGIATATRLLAMKRPDTFVCIASANREALYRAFGIRSNSFDPGNNWAKMYWDEIIQKIKGSNWWKAVAPNGGVERDVWDARAAFLDSLFYDYSGKEL